MAASSVELKQGLERTLGQRDLEPQLEDEEEEDDEDEEGEDEEDKPTMKMSKKKMLKGDQHKIDADGDGKITGKDFQILKNKKKLTLKFKHLSQILKL